MWVPQNFVIEPCHSSDKVRMAATEVEKHFKNDFSETFSSSQQNLDAGRLLCGEWQWEGSHCSREDGKQPCLCLQKVSALQVLLYLRVQVFSNKIIQGYSCLVSFILCKFSFEIMIKWHWASLLDWIMESWDWGKVLPWLRRFRHKLKSEYLWFNKLNDFRFLLIGLTVL